jgi:hypothetical protein
LDFPLANHKEALFYGIFRQYKMARADKNAMDKGFHGVAILAAASKNPARTLFGPG